MAEGDHGGLDRSKPAAFELLTSDLGGEFLGPVDRCRAKR